MLATYSRGSHEDSTRKLRGNCFRGISALPVVTSVSMTSTSVGWHQIVTSVSMWRQHVMNYVSVTSVVREPVSCQYGPMTSTATRWRQRVTSVSVTDVAWWSHDAASWRHWWNELWTRLGVMLAYTLLVLYRLHQMTCYTFNIGHKVFLYFNNRFP